MNDFIILVVVALIIWVIYKVIQKAVYNSRTRVGQPVLIKYYKSKHSYQKDAQELRKYGYEINDVQTIVPRQGCLWLITFGFLRGRKPEITVTYWLTEQVEKEPVPAHKEVEPVASIGAGRRTKTTTIAL